MQTEFNFNWSLPSPQLQAAAQPDTVPRVPRFATAADRAALVEMHRQKAIAKGGSNAN